MVEVISSIEVSVNELSHGNVICIPTETVYGLAADAQNQEAVKKIFDIKNRPTNHPLIIHVYDIQMAEKYASNIPDYAYILMREFWPGPLTFVFNKSGLTNYLVTGGQDTVAIRAPNHEVCRKLIKRFDKGLVAPSANHYGHISATTVDHVLNEFGEEVNYVLNGGACEIGIESTIIDATNHDHFRILRPGVILKSQLETVSKIPCLDIINSTLRVSGAKHSHYAPNKPIYILNSAMITSLDLSTDKVFLITSVDKVNEYSNLNLNIESYHNQVELSSNLYSWLRFGEENYDYTIIESLPNTIEWSALWDRINKAAYNYKNDNLKLI